MRTVGIICEHNPLHNGHRYLMEQVRRQGAEAIVCVMSGNFVQRGELAVVNKFARAEMTVRCGADLVLELPAPWSCAGAETFARGGVQILTDTGVVSELAFGSECGDVAVLQEVADALADPEFDEHLRRHLSGGISYAAAREKALAEMVGEKAHILACPNNILGIEYLKAAAQERNRLRVTTCRRVGAPHDGGAAGDTASASCLRKLLAEGRAEEAMHWMPPEAAQVLRREMENGRAPADMGLCRRAMLSRLRRMTEEELARFDSGGEGLHHRVYRAIQQGTSPEEICELAKTKRYAYARIRRMLLQAWLELTPPLPRPPYLRVLAANATGRHLLRIMRDTGAPVLTKPADVKKLGREAETLFAQECRRTDQYVLSYPCLEEGVCGSDWRAVPRML